jgi:hypothetical protein
VFSKSAVAPPSISFISSFEDCALSGENKSPERDDRVWRSFTTTFLGVFVGGLGVIYLLVLLADPYDTGRFPSFHTSGTYDENKLTASASRARDPRFNAAIFGNSRGQLLDPWRLSQATGLSFVQLTTAGSGPREQLAIMRWFLLHHPHPAAIILQIDERWCSQDPTLPVTFPFPFWLYQGNLEYLTNILSTRTLRVVPKRIRFALGLVPAEDLRGAWDYEASRPWNFKPNIPAEEKPTSAAVQEVELEFPALDQLKTLVATSLPDTPLVALMPPVFYTALPPADSPAAIQLGSCKRAFSRWLSNGPGRHFYDFMADQPLFRDPHNFMDVEHYRSNVARVLESIVVGTFRPRGELIKSDN